jgi:hypothetical protein
MIMKSIYILPLTLAVASASLSVQANTDINNKRVTDTSFNPAISLILDGGYTDYDDEFELPGFQLGGEAGLPEKGFGLGHTELSMSANIDNRFYGSTTLAIESSDETEVELEEAFLETMGLAGGFTIKAGQFFSGIGYLNAVHEHAQDFVDVPLVYAALLGNHLTDQGVQLRWLAPTPFYWLSGFEVTRGQSYPSGDNDTGREGRALFSKMGGDFSTSSSWQFGVFGYQSQFDRREAGAHHHGEDEAETATLALNEGEVELYGIDWVYKWAPDGNPTQRNFKIQAEWMVRDEKGDLQFDEDINSLTADYDGQHQGAYVQAVYQWQPRWRMGLRYDLLTPDNTFNDITEAGLSTDEFFEDTELNADADITQVSAMIDYSYSEFSRLRLQAGRVDTEESADNRLMLQYQMSLGSHGAHAF